MENRKKMEFTIKEKKNNHRHTDRQAALIYNFDLFGQEFFAEVWLN